MANWKGTAVPNNELINVLYLNTNLTSEEMIALIDSVELKELGIDGVSVGAYPLLYNSTFGASLTISKAESNDNPFYTLTIIFDNGSDSSIWNNTDGWNQEGITFFEQGIGANLPIMNELDKSDYFNYYQNDKLSSLLSITPLEQVVLVLDLPTFLTNMANAIRTKKDITGGLWEGTTLVSNPDTMVNNIYFNTDLSVDEVAKILSKLSYIDNQNVLEFPFYIAYANPDLTKCLSFVKVPIGYMIADGNFYTGQFTPLFMSYEENGMYGWIIENKEYQIGFTGVNFVDMLQLAIGDQNDKLSTLISSTPFLEVPPKINAQDFEQEILSITGGVNLLQEKIIDTAVAVPSSGTTSRVCFNINLTEDEVVEIVKSADLPYKEESKHGGIVKTYFIFNGVDYTLTIEDYSSFGAPNAFMIMVAGFVPIFASKGMLEIDYDGFTIRQSGWEYEIIAQLGGTLDFKFNEPVDVNYGNSESEWYCTKNEALRRLVYSDGDIVYTGEYETVKELKGDYYLENYTVQPESTTTYNMLDYLSEKEEITKTGTLLVSNPDTLVEKIYFNTDLSVSEVTNILSTLTYINNTDIYPVPFYVAYANADLSRCISIVGTNGVYVIAEGNFNTGDFIPIFTSAEEQGMVGWLIQNKEYQIGLTGINYVDMLQLAIGDQNNKLTSLISMNNDFEEVTSIKKVFPRNVKVDVTEMETEISNLNTQVSDLNTQVENLTLENEMLASGVVQAKVVNDVVSRKITIDNISYPSREQIYPYEFYEWKIKGITIPNTVKSIGDYAFYRCNLLTSITIPDSVKSIGSYVFENCRSLENITIGNGVTSIGDYAFRYCESLESVTIGNGVTSIGNYTFYYCTSLTDITIPNSVTTIGEATFRYCTSLESVTIGNGVTTIGKYAFQDCDSLASITIPNSVTTIGVGAFGSCSSLTNIIIGSGVTSIGYGAFYRCDGLTSMSVDENNTVYDSRNNCNGIIETGTNTLILGCVNTIIPNTVTAIGERVFSHRYSLTNITIPNSVTSIGDSAFQFCTSLESITIPNSVTSIDEFAFSNCTSLTSVVIPDSVTSIGDAAFSGCSSLTSITVDENNTVYDSRNNCNGIIETGTNTLILGCVNTIIPNTVTAIRKAFSGCTSLTSIVIPDGVTELDQAFSNCTSLTSVVIPDSVEYVHAVFNGCTSLTSVTFLGSINNIGYLMFAFCSSLTSIIIPDGVTRISSYAFMSCTSLSSIAIPSSVTSIGTQAFNNCSSLASIIISKGVTSIDTYTFANCTSLTDVYYTGTEEEWNAISIGSDNEPLTNATIHYNYVAE